MVSSRWSSSVSISPGSIVRAAREQLSCDLAGEAAILDLRNGVYYGLDPVGARIWTLLRHPVAVKDILKSLLEEYDVDAALCEADLLRLLSELASERLIEANDEAPA